MKKYAKLENGVFHELRHVPHVSNPSEETRRAYAESNGYKVYVNVAQPEEGRFRHSYKETAKQIRDVWTSFSAGEMNEIRLAELKQKLADTDYIAAKLAEVEGEERAALLAEYAVALEERKAWRTEIGSLEQQTETAKSYRKAAI